MAKVSIFVVRNAKENVWGYGTTPEQAAQSLISQGMKPKHVKTSYMVRLPEGVTEVDVKGPTLQLTFNSNQPATKLIFDHESNRFVEPVADLVESGDQILVEG